MSKNVEVCRYPSSGSLYACTYNELGISICFSTPIANKMHSLKAANHSTAM